MRGHHYAECGTCGWQSLVVAAREADDLAGAHDDLHHGGRPNAWVSYSTRGA